jgi:peroxin-16
MDRLKQQSQGLRRYLDIYGDFISKNAGAVSQIESALRTLTYIVPGKHALPTFCSEIAKW